MTIDDDLLVEKNVGLDLGERDKTAVLAATTGPVHRDDVPSGGVWINT